MVSRSVRVSVFATALLHAGAHAQSVAPPPEAGAPFETPLAPLPGLGVDWPDLSVRDPLEIATDGAVAATSGESPRYGVRLLGVDGIANVSRRFDELSVLVDNDGRSANAAQIDRRAREDVDLLTRLMRSEGYYDSVIDTALTAAPADGRILVTLTVTPGKRYVFDSVKVDGLAATELVDAYPVRADQPVVAADVIGAQAKLAETLGRRGYPFAVVPDPGVTVDRESGQATLALTVDPGGKRNFGAIRVLGAKPPFDARHAQVSQLLHLSESCRVCSR